jgi:acyl-[acyl-carrier-protein] desaturase
MGMRLLQNPMSKMTTLENRFYENYVEYFKAADSTRRWNPYDDIPWADVNKAPDASVLQVAEAYFGVEMYVPDYTARVLDHIRQSRGRHLFQLQWGFEESKHATAIGLWLVACGAYDEKKLREHEQVLLSEKWTPLFDDPLRLLCYTVLQEYATRLNYTRLREYATRVGYVDPAFDKTFLLLARDEAAHFGFFKKCLSVYLEHFRDESLEAMNEVIVKFEMPARAIIPQWEVAEKKIVDLDIFTNRLYMREVVHPCLKSLGIDRQELRASRKAAA